jgi:pimeloyl-ACP methyl ester carboxylesterase
MTHGWPSTFADFAGIVGPLVGGDPAFHVVVPSLPGGTAR